MLTLAIVGHLVGDYLLQNDWMALNKKSRSLPCIVHCSLWTLSVCAFTGWWNPLVIAVLFATHFIQDRTQIIIWWMRLIGQKQFMRCDETNPITYEIKVGLGPWSIIVVDNV